MATFVEKLLAPTGSTGNNTHPAVGIEVGTERLAAQFVVEVIGATPTVTYKFQGSFDGVNWVDLPYVTAASDTLAVATVAITTVSANQCWLDVAGDSRFFTQIRCVTTANTNVTYRAELYCNVRP